MGRWPYSDRRTVECSKPLSISYLNQNNFLDGNIHKLTMKWRRAGKIVGRIGLKVSPIIGDPYVQLTYIYANDTIKQKLDYKVRLISTPCNFGGFRWWYCCPIIKNKSPCNRRIGVLYLANTSYFGCRHCHNLTYISCKENHKFDAFISKLGITPEQAKLFLK